MIYTHSCIHCTRMVCTMVDETCQDCLANGAAPRVRAGLANQAGVFTPPLVLVGIGPVLPCADPKCCFRDFPHFHG